MSSAFRLPKPFCSLNVYLQPQNIFEREGLTGRRSSHYLCYRYLQSALRSRQRKQETFAHLSTALRILSAKVQALEKRTEAIEKTLLFQNPNPPQTEAPSSVRNDVQVSEAMDTSVSKADEEPEHDDREPQIDSVANFALNCLTSLHGDGESEDNDAVEQLITRCLEGSD